MHYCIYCTYFDPTNKRQFQDEYRCKNRGIYVKPNDGYKCSYYNRNFKDYPENKNKMKPCGFSFINVINDILNLNNGLLDLFVQIKNTILSCDANYIPELLNYENMNEEISVNLLAMDNQVNYCSNLVKSFIIPCINAFKNSSLFEVIQIYQNMMNYIANTFGLNKNLENSSSRLRMIESV